MATPDRLEHVRATWESVSRRDCLIFTDYAEVDERGATLNGSVLGKYPSLNAVATTPLATNLSLLSKEAAFTALLRTGCFIRPCAIAAPRTVFDAVGGYDERLRNGQDYDIFLRIAWQFPFVWLHRNLALYRTAAGNISSRPASAVVPSRLAVLERLLELPLDRAQERAVRKTMAENYEALAYDQGRSGQTLKSLSAYARAFCNSPQGRHLRGMASSLIKGVFAPRSERTRSPV
jgi:hypothetical protein